MVEQDPIKDPEFQKVIHHFVTTPHRPHESLGSQNKRSKVKMHKECKLDFTTKLEKSVWGRIG
jgi:hypothetical protein